MNWPEVKLGDVIHQERERVGSFDGNGLPVFGVTNVDGVTQTGIETSRDRSKYLRLHPNRFVYNPYRINVGSIGLSSENQDGIVSPAYVVFAPSEKIDANYLFHFLKSARGNQLINFYGNRGTVRSALRFIDLYKIEIPLPPLFEQHKVVTRVEKLALQVAEAKDLRQQSAFETEALLSAASARILGVPTVNLGEVADVTKLAGFEYTKYFTNSMPGDIKVVRAGNVRNNGLDLRKTMTITEETSNSLPRSQLRTNDVLLTFIGAGIGDTTYVRDDHPPLHCGPNVAKLTPGGQISHLYLVKVLQSPLVQKQIKDITKSTAQPSLSMKTIRLLKIPVPSLSKQRRIVEFLDELTKKIEMIKSLQAETVVELEALLPSILDKAFKGEL